MTIHFPGMGKVAQMWVVCVAYLTLQAVSVTVSASYFLNGETLPLWLSLASYAIAILAYPAIKLMYKIDEKR